MTKTTVYAIISNRSLQVLILPFWAKLANITRDGKYKWEEIVAECLFAKQAIIPPQSRRNGCFKMCGCVVFLHYGTTALFWRTAMRYTLLTLAVIMFIGCQATAGSSGEGNSPYTSGDTVSSADSGSQDSTTAQPADDIAYNDTIPVPTKCVVSSVVDGDNWKCTGTGATSIRAVNQDDFCGYDLQYGGIEAQNAEIVEANHFLGHKTEKVVIECTR